MSQKRDYYEVLGVSKEASGDELRKAYRAAALKSHPDRNPGDKEAEARFKEATEAYGVLSDDQKRARYDRFGHAGMEGMPDMQQGDIFTHFQDIFSELFGGFGGGGGFAGGGGGQRRRNGPSRGQDLRVEQRLTLREAMTGTKREVSLRTPVPCDICSGTGAKPGSKRKSCSTCDGQGQVSTARGFVMFTQTCPTCRGEGSTNSTPCAPCQGQGAVEKNRKVVVTFPAGIDAGQRLRVPGQGMAGGQGGPSGDLYVDVDLAPDDNFERHESDLVTRFVMPYAKAALGGAVELTLPDDSTVSVDVPAGSQPGDVVTVRGHGMPRIDGRGRGSLQVIVQVAVPKTVSARAKELLEQLDAELKTTSS